MNELTRIIFEHLNSDDGPEIFGEFGGPASSEELLEIAQSIAEAIVAAGWPRKD